MISPHYIEQTGPTQWAVQLTATSQPMTIAGASTAADALAILEGLNSAGPPPVTAPEIVAECDRVIAMHLTAEKRGSMLLEAASFAITATLTDEQRVDLVMIQTVNAWETAMIAARSAALAAPPAALADIAWPPPPAGLADFLEGY